jgi:hypothetical protein
MSARPQHHDWDPIYKGEDVDQPFQTDPATDITSWTIVSQIKAIDPTTGLPTGSALATGTVTKLAPLTGSYKVTYTSAQTNALPLGRVFVDVWRFDIGTKKVLNEGFVPVLPYETQF